MVEKINERSRLPDHRAIKLTVQTSHFVLALKDKNLRSKQAVRARVIREMPNLYMEGERAARVIETLVNQCEVMHDNQEFVDKCYLDLISLLDSELKQGDNTDSEKVGRRKCTPHKPYWNKELSQMWKKTKDQSRELCRMKKDKTESWKIKEKTESLSQAIKAFD